MNELVRLRARPRLNSPNMLAAWPGVGNVAMIAATYLLRKLNFKELGEIEPSSFFDPVGVVVRDNVVEEPKFPQSKFYYWKNKDKASDTILFIGEDQPASKNYELANCVLDVAQRFQVNRIYTCAAALTRIHHTEPPRVWGVATSQNTAQDLKKYELLSDKELKKELKKIAKQHKGLPLKAVIGKAMQKLRGKADGKKIVEILKREIT